MVKKNQVWNKARVPKAVNRTGFVELISDSELSADQFTELYNAKLKNVYGARRIQNGEILQIWSAKQQKLEFK